MEDDVEKDFPKIDPQKYLDLSVEESQRAQKRYRLRQKTSTEAATSSTRPQVPEPEAEDRAAQIPVPDAELDEDLAVEEDPMLGDSRDGERDLDGVGSFGPLPSDTRSSSSKQRYQPYFTLGERSHWSTVIETLKSD